MKLLRQLLKSIFPENIYNMIYRFYWNIVPIGKGRRWRKVIKAKKRYSKWIKSTSKLHSSLNLNYREFMYNNGHVYIKSNYNVWFAYVQDFGLRNMEMNGTNDRIQIDFLLKNTSHDAVLFDLGASYGYYSLTFAKEKPFSSVIAFEPSPKAFNYLCMNKKINKLDNVTISSKAISDIKGIVHGKGNLSDFGVSYISISQNESAQVYTLKSINIDDYFRLKNLKRLDYIKIDIEGAEFPAIKGGFNTIQKYRPIIQCELDNNFAYNRFGYNINEVFQLLGNNGYIFFYLPNENYVNESGCIMPVKSIDEAISESHEFFFIPEEQKPYIKLDKHFHSPIEFPYIQ